MKRIEIHDDGSKTVTRTATVQKNMSLEALANMDTDSVKVRSVEPPDHFSPEGHDSEMQALVNRATRALKFKGKMIEKSLVRGKVECDQCQGFWQAYLPEEGKRHIKIHCDGVCGFMFME